MNTKLYFKSKSQHQQCFKYPTDVIKHMAANCPARVWPKLIRTCKYFYAKEKAMVFMNVSFKDGIIYATQKFDDNKWDSDRMPCNVILGGKAVILDSFSLYMPAIKKCDLRELIAYKTEFSFAEFDFLVGAQTLETINFTDVHVKNANGSILPLEDIFAKLPNATSFVYKNSDINSADSAINTQTFRQMARTSRKRKLLVIEIHVNIQDINTEDFVEFVHTCAASNCRMKLSCASIPNISMYYPFKAAIIQMVEQWTPHYEQPDIQFLNEPFGFHVLHVPVVIRQPKPKIDVPASLLLSPVKK